jgi:hypothetical protein
VSSSVEVKKLNECGYVEALYGLTLNKNQPIENMGSVAQKLCNKDGGHNKFLEHIVVWLYIRAPRFIWQEFDTYRIGVSKSSESTMHTILKRPLSEDDFDQPIGYWRLRRLNKLIENREFLKLKNELPEGFMQARMICINYKSLRNMINQRKNHRLPHWKEMIEQILDQLDHPELLNK